ncbi:MAG: DUF1801 domain-containing protein [Flavobacteriaceae bacterium]|nr:DUF1801 domain-containing protein [Flavobacteriaceae bacterium]
MQYKAVNAEDYISQLPEERQQPMQQLRQAILKNLPAGFEEHIGYGMVGYSVPHSTYPNGYHCDPKQPLPFISIASQKNFIALYHFGIYAHPPLLAWFIEEYPKHCNRKLDMGKSCIRFKKIDEIPFKLIEQLCSKMSVDEWIEIYERNLKR